MDTAALDAVCLRHRVQLLVQHGSTVSGRTHPQSDLDLAVLLDRVPATADYLGLIADLQTVFPGENLDIALLNTADPLLLKKVTERCRLLYGTRRRLTELQLYAFKRFQDYRRFLALERQYVVTKLDPAVR